MMAPAALNAILLAEPDRQAGGRLQHLFPSHEHHLATTECPCRPVLILHSTVDAEEMGSVRIYWHRWAGERVGSGGQYGL